MTSDSDHAVVEEMLRPYRGAKFDAVPPDPRRIDVGRITALRERLSSPYSYRWRESQADLDIALALFDGRESHGGGIIRLTHGFRVENADGEGPPFGRSPIPWGERDGYRRRYYLTVAISSARGYVGDLTDAEGLLGSVLPGWGYEMHLGPGGRRLRLVRGDEHGPWVALDPPARALVVALLTWLEGRPEDAAPWREP